jgi:hypothetical protein
MVGCGMCFATAFVGLAVGAVLPSWPPELRCLSGSATTGDYTPDLRALLAADIIIATPEKWDSISRAWQTRAYVSKVLGLRVICCFMTDTSAACMSLMHDCEHNKPVRCIKVV